MMPLAAKPSQNEGGTVANALISPGSWIRLMMNNTDAADDHHVGGHDARVECSGRFGDD